ncbi:type IVB secretion system protein IcmH/DotU [Endozoicomonadaceae bacterium StTr2]
MMTDDEPTQLVSGNALEPVSGAQAQTVSRSEQLVEQQQSILGRFRPYDNPLLSQGTELMAVILALPRMEQPREVAEFRQSMLEEIVRLRHRLLQQGVKEMDVARCCFLYCAVLDEMIVQTTWGMQVNWESNSLLSRAFKRRDGGDVFYLLVNRACTQPDMHLDFLELAWVFVNLGFRGRCRIEEQHRTSELNAQLFRLLSQFRKSEPFTPIIGLPDSRHKLPKPVFWFWPCVALLMVVLLSSAGAGTWVILRQDKPLQVLQQLEQTRWPLPENIQSATMQEIQQTLFPREK